MSDSMVLRPAPEGWLASRVQMLNVAVIVLVGTACASADYTTVDLRPYFDNDGISYRANLADGDFNCQCLYPAEEMPSPGECTLAGVPFEFPDYSDGLNNCVRLRGKTIDLPDVPARTIYLLGSALLSKYPSARATLYYVDGPSEQHLITLDSWGQRSCAKVLETSVFHVQNRIADGGGWPLYVTTIYPQRDVPLDGIVFDDAFTGAQAFAITLSTEAPTGELAKKLPPFGIASIDWGLPQTGEHRAGALVLSVRGHTSKVNVEWACGEQKKTETIEVEPGEPTPLEFRCQLAPGGNRMSLTLTDDAGLKLAVSRELAVKPLIVVRTERLVVIDDAAPIEVEVIVNVDVAERQAHGLVVELVTFQNEKEGDIVDTQTIGQLDRRSHIVKFPAAKTPHGPYKVRARLTQDDETVAQAKTQMILRRPRPKGGVRKVRFDADGMMLIDGKRTFAIGMLANLASKSDVTELKAAGANCVMIGGPTMGRQAGLWEFFDALHEAGIYVVGSVSPEEDQFNVRCQTNLQREHPAIIGYHFLEEPGGRYADWPGALAMIHQSAMTIRRTDPDHFIDLIDWPASSYARYETFVDMIIPDRYTRGTMPTPNIVRSTIQQIQQAFEGSQYRKPVWIMPQMFSFLVESRQGMTKDPAVPEGPTPEQVRLSGYAGIVAGAKGIVFFCDGYARYTSNGQGGVSWEGPDNLWDASKHVLTEIAQLRPVLEAVGKSRTVEATEGIETWAKQHDGRWTIIAVNATEKPLEATIDLSGLKIKGKPIVLFERDRPCAFDDGKIMDAFTADGAHIYELEIAGR